MIPLAQEFRQAYRRLRRSPGFSAVAIAILGVGIGANTALFSVLDGLLLRPFPFERLDRIVALFGERAQAARQGDAAHGGSGRRSRLSFADLDDFRASGRFEAIAAYTYRESTLETAAGPERMRAAVTGSEFFPLLGVRPLLGRSYSAEEANPGLDAVAVASHGFAETRFGSAEAALGRRLRLDGESLTIVGVMPPGFAFPLGGVQLWLPLAPTPAQRADRGAAGLLAVGRLADATSLAEARAEIARIARRAAERFPATNAGRGAILIPLTEQQVGFTARFAYMFQGAAFVVLLVISTNLANLILARGAARRGELAVRAALGAGRARLACELFAESLLLAAAGGLVALGVARLAVDWIRTAMPYEIAKWVAGWNAVELDPRALAFTFAAAAATALLFGLEPARRASRARLADLVDTSGRGGESRRTRVAGIFVAAQVALGLVLLSVAAQLVSGFGAVASVYRGFDPGDVLSFRLALSEREAATPAASADFYRSLLERLGALSSVASAAAVGHLPADLGPIPGTAFELEERPTDAASELPVADLQPISPDYFAALKVALERGRLFTVRDDAAALPVAIVSRSLAERHWPGQNPIGRRLRLGARDPDAPWVEIVGVVADLRQYWFDREPRLTIYRPLAQLPRPGMWIVLRASAAGGGAELTAAARATVASLAPWLPLDEIRTLDTVVEQALAFVRIATVLLVALAALALAISLVGVAAVIANAVGRRRHELGIRLALGARARPLLLLVLGEGLRWAALGVALGLGASLALGRLLEARLFGLVQPSLASSAALLAALLAAVVVASLVPGRAALRLDPATVLREP
jgi:putative ABC transport system permease protein